MWEPLHGALEQLCPSGNATHGGAGRRRWRRLRSAAADVCAAPAAWPESAAGFVLLPLRAGGDPTARACASTGARRTRRPVRPAACPGERARGRQPGVVLSSTQMNLTPWATSSSAAGQLRAEWPRCVRLHRCRRDGPAAPVARYGGPWMKLHRWGWHSRRWCLRPCASFQVMFRGQASNAHAQGRCWRAASARALVTLSCRHAQASGSCACWLSSRSWRWARATHPRRTSCAMAPALGRHQRCCAGPRRWLPAVAAAGRLGAQATRRACAPIRSPS